MCSGRKKPTKLVYSISLCHFAQRQPNSLASWESKGLYLSMCFSSRNLQSLALSKAVKRIGANQPVLLMWFDTKMHKGFYAWFTKLFSKHTITNHTTKKKEKSNLRNCFLYLQVMGALNVPSTSTCFS